MSGTAEWMGDTAVSMSVTPWPIPFTEESITETADSMPRSTPLGFASAMKSSSIIGISITDASCPGGRCNALLACSCSCFLNASRSPGMTAKYYAPSRAPSSAYAGSREKPMFLILERGCILLWDSKLEDWLKWTEERRRTSESQFGSVVESLAVDSRRARVRVGQTMPHEPESSTHKECQYSQCELSLNHNVRVEPRQCHKADRSELIEHVARSLPPVAVP
ncbi:hypothetical protein AG1IA_04520 [Rhizoctonia solani AG-1 IA]|uniref:Uncharacterized protein n=1 Tax=Thanatephorus cucumeris (strain AG1-IA) TaxID=983506 RepID=L8WYL0_THACA|nr:hypothetical protein AG1IA_04520 [Rhizoctonia solani AG-1 IA]